MNRGERIRRTQNIIKKRWRLLMRWMMPRGTETKIEAQNAQVLTPHHLSKYNLNCTCSMCKRERYNRSKQKRKIRKEVEEQLNDLDKNLLG